MYYAKRKIRWKIAIMALLARKRTRDHRDIDKMSQEGIKPHAWLNFQLFDQAI